ncbi:MAG: hypothetical protein KatS3mg131_1582 [Candidatus Tectimicrobiota bacterium]|nr:MAG: hypothetical protein KatS3mg131_1582 [Candidatus Tectomicrobia bacterium]
MPSQGKRVLLVTIGVWLALLAGLAGAQEGFRQQDRELLLELNVRVGEFDKRFEQIDKRFEQIDKRFEQVDKRFEQIDKRFEQIDKRFEQVDKRFEQVDKRFAELRQDMNQRFAQLTQFLYILSGIFTALVVAVIGFAYWDRRTIIREARREAIEWMEKEGTLRRVVDTLREVAREDTRMAEALRRADLL